LTSHAQFIALAGLKVGPTRKKCATRRVGRCGLLTAPGYCQPHTAFEGVDFLKRREGPVKCILHPSDAGRRNLAHGDVVRPHNDSAKVRMVLHVSDEVQPGVVLVSGQSSDEDETAGTVNMLCSDRFTDIGAGDTYQSTYLDISRWSDRAS
jgi:anaerobic selenocysteine-containing dehydrogenase